MLLSETLSGQFFQSAYICFKAVTPSDDSTTKNFFFFADSCGSLLEAFESPRIMSHLSSLGDHICNWTIRAASNQIVEITSLQIFNETDSDHLFVRVVSNDFCYLEGCKCFHFLYKSYFLILLENFFFFFWFKCTTKSRVRKLAPYYAVHLGCTQII